MDSGQSQQKSGKGIDISATRSLRKRWNHKRKRMLTSVIGVGFLLFEGVERGLFSLFRLLSKEIYIYIYIYKEGCWGILVFFKDKYE